MLDAKLEKGSTNSDVSWTAGVHFLLLPLGPKVMELAPPLLLLPLQVTSPLDRTLQPCKSTLLPPLIWKPTPVVPSDTRQYEVGTTCAIATDLALMVWFAPQPMMRFI